MPMQVKKNFVTFPTTGASFKAISPANLSLEKAGTSSAYHSDFLMGLTSRSEMTAFKSSDDHPARPRTARSSGSRVNFEMLPLSSSIFARVAA
jgi:hypothetical protein